MSDRAERLDDPVEPPVPLHGRGNGTPAAHRRNGGGAQGPADPRLTGLALMMDVYAAETPYLVSMLTSLCPEAVEDVLQDVAELAIAAAPGFTEPGKAIGWLRKTARHHGLHARRVARQHEPIPPERLANIPAADGDPAALAVAGEERRILRAALASLPPGRRAALALNLTGLAQSEIARELGVGRNAVRRRLVQGRKQVIAHTLGIANGIVCRGFERSILERVSGTLEARRAEALDAHLEICSGCRAHLAQVRRQEARLYVVFPPALVSLAGVTGGDDSAVTVGHEIGASLAEMFTSLVHGAWARAADAWFAMTQLGRLITVGAASALALVGLGTLASPRLHDVAPPREVAVVKEPVAPVVTRSELTRRISGSPRHVAKAPSTRGSKAAPAAHRAPVRDSGSVSVSTQTRTPRSPIRTRPTSPPPSPPPVAPAGSGRASAMVTAEFRPGPGTGP